jgi:DNA-binding response OmpR family regulator
MQNALIIDDDSDLCYLLREVFRSNNIEALIAPSLSEAKILLHNYSPTIIVLDNTLPDGMGFDFLPYLKSRNKKSEIIFITGDYDSNQQDYSAPEISHSLHKPFSINAFKKILENILAEPGK